MSDLIAKATARRKALLAEIEKLDEFIRLARELGEDEPPNLSTDQIAANATRRLKEHARRKRESRSQVIVGAAKEILIKHGRPMTRFELVAALEEVGVEIGGTDKPRNLGTILWRSPDIESTGDGYWPIGVERKQKRAIVLDL